MKFYNTTKVGKYSKLFLENFTEKLFSAKIKAFLLAPQSHLTFGPASILVWAFA